jgi:hypothetical protein
MHELARVSAPILDASLALYCCEHELRDRPVGGLQPSHHGADELTYRRSLRHAIAPFHEGGRGSRHRCTLTLAKQRRRVNEQ